MATALPVEWGSALRSACVETLAAGDRFRGALQTLDDITHRCAAGSNEGIACRDAVLERSSATASGATGVDVVSVTLVQPGHGAVIRCAGAFPSDGRAGYIVERMRDVLGSTRQRAALSRPAPETSRPSSQNAPAR